MMRYLLNVHITQSRVQDIMVLPKMSEQIAVLQEALMNQGNFRHNC